MKLLLGCTEKQAEVVYFKVVGSFGLVALEGSERRRGGDGR
jgi:hypothetical protein